MLHLRLKQHAVGEGRHRVDISLDGDGAPRVATSTFAFGLSPQDEGDLRWYLEDFLQYPQEPAPTIARRIEGRWRRFVAELYEAAPLKLFPKEKDDGNLKIHVEAGAGFKHDL